MQNPPNSFNGLKVLIIGKENKWSTRKICLSSIEKCLYDYYNTHNNYVIHYDLTLKRELKLLTMLSSIEWDLVIITALATGYLSNSVNIYNIYSPDLSLITKTSKLSLVYVMDEYFNTSIYEKMFIELKINIVFSVLYKYSQSFFPNAIKNGTEFFATGTTMINQEILKYSGRNKSYFKRKYDFSYSSYPQSPRTGWFSILKEEIANHIIIENNFKQYISVSPSRFKNRKSWYTLLSDSIIVTNSISGSDVLDYDGRIDEFIKSNNLKCSDYMKIYDNFPEKSSLNMSVISPRIIEAGLFNCLQILPFKDRESLLNKSDYIELKTNFDNKELNIENLRLRIDKNKYYEKAFRSKLSIINKYYYLSDNLELINSRIMVSFKESKKNIILIKTLIELSKFITYLLLEIYHYIKSIRESFVPKFKI